eukprot:m.277233 g.277233  ORF g.277233 m.277233 type:complete len:113 (+) comp40608_c0_seq12:27-365(+)
MCITEPPCRVGAASFQLSNGTKWHARNLVFAREEFRFGSEISSDRVEVGMEQFPELLAEEGTDRLEQIPESEDDVAVNRRTKKNDGSDDAMVQLMSGPEERDVGHTGNVIMK